MPEVTQRAQLQDTMPSTCSPTCYAHPNNNQLQVPEAGCLFGWEWQVVHLKSTPPERGLSGCWASCGIQTCLDGGPPSLDLQGEANSVRAADVLITSQHACVHFQMADGRDYPDKDIADNHSCPPLPALSLIGEWPGGPKALSASADSASCDKDQFLGGMKCTHLCLRSIHRQHGLPHTTQQYLWAQRCRHSAPRPGCEPLSLVSRHGWGIQRPGRICWC